MVVESKELVKDSSLPGLELVMDVNFDLPATGLSVLVMGDLEVADSMWSVKGL